MQRIITPICEEKQGNDSKGPSPVEYKPIKFPESKISDDSSSQSQSSPESLQVRDQRIRSKSESAKPDDHSQSTSTSRTGSSDVYAEPVEGPGFEELTRFESPPPADEMIAQRKNESRFRLTLQHNFHPSRE
jgi:abelson tyrosine-protein kinase 1